MNLKDVLVQALEPLVGEHLTPEAIEQLIEIPRDPSHGDLAFPTFQLARVYRTNPAQIATDLAEKMDSTPFESIETVGPYINVKLDRTKVGQEIVSDILTKESHFGENNLGNDEALVIDMSSPNIAKTMSMGHLRSTVIGNAIANLAKKSGYRPVKINHLGDWGTQFGKLIVAYQKWGDPERLKDDPITELVKLYVRFHEEAEEHPELEDEGREAFRKLEEGDEEKLKLWEQFREDSLKEFQEVYDLLDVTFDSYSGEAFYNDKMQPIVEELEEKNLLELSEGASIVDLGDDLPPAIIRKSDGATLYITRDLAAALYRMNKYNFAKAVYVVGNEQRVHFEQLREVLGKMGYDWAENIIHAPFGLIMQDGKKLSTRAGRIVLLQEVLDEAIRLALKQIEEKNPDLENKEEIARQVGVGAVIFYDLRNERMTGYGFELEDIVQFEGETGPYVQYTFARAMSILRRVEDVEVDENVVYTLTDDYSWELIKRLNQYPEVVKQATEQLEPALIARYVISVAQLFNRYYANVRILDEDSERPARIALLKAMTIVLKDGLELLGLKAPEEM